MINCSFTGKDISSRLGRDFTLPASGMEERSTGSWERPSVSVACPSHSNQEGNPREMTVVEFAHKILELTGSVSPLEFHPLPVDDPKTRQPDIRQARSLLHWEPEVSLEEGLQKTIAYFTMLLKSKA